MTITVDITPEIQVELASQAAAQGRPLEAYVAALLKQAAASGNDTPKPKRERPPGGKSLVQLFAESPFSGLDMDFERGQDFGRDIDL